MKTFFTFICVFFALVKTTAQGFNGSIEFKHYTQKDTNNNVYTVKNKFAKLDRFSKQTTTVEGSFIFDLGANKIRWVNPKRKVWGEHMSETPPVIRGECVVTKGSATKTVAGMKCHEYTVKNTEENTIITYWVAGGNFDFFIPLLKLWNRKDKQSIYFNHIQDLPVGSMPMLSEEKQLSDGKVISKLEVVKINTKMPEDASLEVPAAYTRFDQ